MASYAPMPSWPATHGMLGATSTRRRGVQPQKAGTLMDLNNRLAGRSIIVTGGGSGIGKGTSQRLAAEGALVTVLDIRSALADDVAAGIRADGGSAIAASCDVTNEEHVAKAVAKTVDEFGGVYGLFANAGTAGLGWLHETSLDDWNFVLGVNLTGPFLCSKHTIPHMLEAGSGSIVMTSSIAGSVIGGGGAAASYAVSKAGVIQLARQIAVDYGRQGIRANAIQPGGVLDSNMAKHVAEDRAFQKANAITMDRQTPFLPIKKRGHTRDEYGATVAFLMSDDAGYITGSSLPVDGGYLAT